VLVFEVFLRTTREVFGRLRVLAVLAGVIVAGALLFAAADHRSFGTALYWAVTTASTVGYGDVTPTSAWGRVVAVGVMLTAIPLLALMFANATSVAAEIRIRRLLGIGGGRRVRDHTLILGWNTRADVAARELLTAGFRLCVVADVSALPVDDPQADYVRGDPMDEAALRRAGADSARAALVCLDDDGDTVMAVIALRHLNPQLPVACLVKSEHARAALADLGVRAVLPVDELVGHALAKSVEAPHAGQLLLRLVDSPSYRVREVALDAVEDGESLSSLRQRSHLPLVLGIVHDREVRIAVADDVTLAPGDRLLVLEDDGDARKRRA
jgi:voltage-gated potassium channel